MAVKYGLTGSSFTHTLSDRLTTPSRGAYRACSRELRRAPENGRDVGRWVPRDGYPSYTYPYPTYGGPGAVTGDVAGRQGRRVDPGPMAWDQGGKGVNQRTRIALGKLFGRATGGTEGHYLARRTLLLKTRCS